MKSFLQGAAAFFFVVLAGCVLTLTLAARENLKHSDLALQHLDKVIGDIDEVLDHAAAIETQFDAGLSETRSTLWKLNGAADAELKYWNTIGKNSADATRDLRVLISKTDRELNDKFLPDLDAQLGQTSLGAQSATASAAHSFDTLTLQLNDPAIAQLAEHLNQSAANLADATKHTDAATADIEQAVHRLTRPPSLAKRIGTTILGIGAQLGSIFAGFVK